MITIPLTFYSDQACTTPDPAGLFFRGAKNAEESDSGNVVNQAWVRYGARWGSPGRADGGAAIRVVADAGPGRPLGENDPGLDFWALPAGVRFVLVEGSREHAGVIVAVDLLQQAV